MGKFKTPILLLIFNRPGTTNRVLQRIKSAEPSKLYIAADGPRKGNPNEKEKCEQARNIATTIDWECEVKTLFRNENLGCKLAVSSAITWFFDQEEKGIILEDDCVPNDSFFKFCEELLKKYEHVNEVMTISGNNFQPKRRTKYSYYFSKYMHCWGWASWRRAWKHFDIEMEGWLELRKEGFLPDLFKSKRAQEYWTKIFDAVNAGEIDSWAYIWTYSIWKAGGVNILPEENLVKNIGFAKNGTHTKDSNSDKANLVTNPLSFPLNHPKEIIINSKADKYTQFRHFQTPLVLRAFKKIIKVLSV